MNSARMKHKTILVMLFAALFAGTLVGGCVGVSRHARAAEQTSLTQSNASLALPTSYEQYLAMKQPTDVAMSASHIAIADEKTLYVYDRETKSYSKKDITENNGTITKIGFAKEKLFVAVSASSNYFYEYDFEGQEFKNLSINCSTFCISDDTLYTASIGEQKVTLASYSVSTLISGNSSSNDLGKLSASTTPSMTKLGNILYCTINDRVYHINLDNETFDDTTQSSYLSLNSEDTKSVYSTCAHMGFFYYTAEGGLYRAELSTSDNNAKKATCVLEGENFGALTSYGGSLYCVRGQSVLRFDPASDGTNYTIADYEISSASASVGRLSGAKDVARAGSLVVIADTENSRVSVYDSETDRYTVLTANGEFSPALVATDGEVIAAASGNQVYVCKDPKKSAQFETPVSLNHGNIKGIACVYGNVYYVTENNYYGVLEGTSVTKSNSNAPALMTSDLYGNLYVAYSDTVRSFTEEEFIGQNAEGTLLEGVTVPANAKALRAGFDGTLYYLDENGNLCSAGGETTETLATIDGKDFVYTGGENKTPVSFALGYEDDEVYFLFGDFIVKSNAGALGLETPWQLSDATDIVRAGDLLVMADTGNKRVTVYDMQKHSFAIIRTEFSPALVATDGEVIAAASGNQVYVCKDPSGNPNFGEPTTADIGTIKGLACVNGTAYYITEYGYGKVENEDKGLVSRLEDRLVALTVDDEGILYVVDSSGYVRYYYEEEFADPDVVSGGYTGKCLNTPVSSLRADSEGNLYYLSENALWKNDTKLAEFGKSSSGYGSENSPVAFALDFKNDDVYLLYGDYIVRTEPNALGFSLQNHNDILGNRQDILPPDSRRKKESTPIARGIFR